MMLRTMRWTFALAAAAALAACGGGDKAGSDGAAGDLSGAIQIDGSSTVYPITEAVAEEFGKETGGKVRVTVGVSGTGGGFKRFCAGQTDISDASRPIKAEERTLCEQNDVTFVDVPVAYDGIAVVVNPANTWVDCLTTDELKKIWQPSSTVKTWADVRAGWPAEPIKLYGPGTDSGTFDYFTEELMGKSGASRPDYSASEDDNVLVQGVEGDKGALGYFGFAYFEENQDRLKLVPVNGGKGCVTPSIESIKGGTYAPLSRPLFIYISRKAMARPEVAAFARYYIDSAPELTAEVGYVPLDAARYQQSMQVLTSGGAGEAAPASGASGPAAGDSARK